MTLKFEKDNSTKHRSWNVSFGDMSPFGRIGENNMGRLGFHSIAGYSVPDNWLTEIVAFIRQQSGEAAPTTADPALEKRVAELEKLVAPMVEREKRIADAEFFILKRCREIAMVSKFNLVGSDDSDTGWVNTDEGDAREVEACLRRDLSRLIDSLCAQMAKL